MRILLDTHIFLWYVKDDRLLSKQARALIQQAEEVYVSSVSIWEATIKAQLGKLDVDIDKLVTAIHQSGFLELPLSAEHAANLMQFAEIHRDPFDRVLIAQAMMEPLKFLTSDEVLQKYSDLVTIV